MSEAKRIIEDSLALPAAERVIVVRELLASLEGADEDAAERWLAEIEQRCRQVDAGEATTAEWAAVRERIAARIRES